MSFTEWYKEHQSLDKVSFEREFEIYKYDAIAKLGGSTDNNVVYLVNAGRMNHGKSSLFNSLLGREEFQARDIRTTVKNKEIKWKDNIILVDTPGLDAVDEDTSEAYEAYYKADIIFFVHTVRTGELHDSEIAAIKKISQNFSKEYFWKHFCLVFSFMESVDVESLAKIITESVESIKRECKADDFATFAISNSRYIKGITENKKGLVNHSGILDLLDYIDNQVDGWNRDSINKNVDVIKENLVKLYKEARCVVEEEKRNDAIDNNVPGGGKSVDELREIVKDLKIEMDKLQDDCNKRDKEFWSLQDKIRDLNKKNLDLIHTCPVYKLEAESDKLDREIDRLMNLSEKIERESSMMMEELEDKEDEAQLTCVKLGILDESQAFNYRRVMENIDKMASQQKNAVKKLDYVRDFCNELEKIGKTDNLLLFVQNGEIGKHLRILDAVAELLGDADIKKDKTVILDKIQQNNGKIATDKEFKDSLHRVYQNIYDTEVELKNDIFNETRKIDKVIDGYMQEADDRRKKIRAVIDVDAYFEKNNEILEEMSRATEAGNSARFNMLCELHDQRSNEFKRLIDERTAMMDKATKYFRSHGVLGEVDKFYTDTIYEYIEKFADGLYEDNVNDLQEKLRKITKGLKSVQAIGELVGVKVAE